MWLSLFSEEVMESMRLKKQVKIDLLPGFSSQKDERHRSLQNGGHGNSSSAGMRNELCDLLSTRVAPREPNELAERTELARARHRASRGNGVLSSL